VSETTAITFAPTKSTPSPTIISDALVMMGRGLRLARRNVDAVVTGLILPVMLLFVFVYLFGGAIRSSIDYVDYVVPGVILISVSMGAATTAISVNHDMMAGIIDRFRSMDISGGAVLSGHVVASAVRNTISTLLVLSVALAIGFRPHGQLEDCLVAMAVLLLYVLAFSWLAAAVGLVTKSPEAANGFTFFALFLTYPSSALVPVQTMPSWIRGFAGHQPVTLVIDSLRSSLLGSRPDGTPWTAIAWCLGILVASMVLTAVAFQRRNST
jgi:ABC-2 type transport system permease protein